MVWFGLFSCWWWYWCCCGCFWLLVCLCCCFVMLIKLLVLVGGWFCFCWSRMKFIVFWIWMIIGLWMVIGLLLVVIFLRDCCGRLKFGVFFCGWCLFISWDRLWKWRMVRNLCCSLMVVMFGLVMISRFLVVVRGFLLWLLFFLNLWCKIMELFCFLVVVRIIWLRCFLICWWWLFW